MYYLTEEKNKNIVQASSKRFLIKEHWLKTGIKDALSHCITNYQTNAVQIQTSKAVL